MSRRSLFRLSVLVVGLAMVVCPLPLSARQKEHYRGRKFKPPPPTSRITVTVLRNDDDSPIMNAHVVFQPIVKGKPRGGMELKTNYDGKCVMTVIPIGDPVLVQVIVNGYQTFGKIYNVERAEMGLHIHMKLPGQQYSIYDNNPDKVDSGSSNGSSNNSGSGSANASGKQSNSGGAAKNNNGSGAENSGSESKSAPDQKSVGQPQ